MFFYSKDASGASTGSQTLWIPYTAVAVVVVVLSIIFYFAPMPDVRASDEYNLDDGSTNSARPPVSNRGLVLGILWVNIVVLAVAVGMIVTAIAAIFGAPEGQTLLISSLAIAAIGSAVLFARKGKITNQSMWSHTHFSSATLAQFFYVAGQCGIFGFFINYMTSQIPAVPNFWRDGMNNFANSMGPLNVGHWLNDWFEIHSNTGLMGFSDGGASMLASLAFVFFLVGRFTGASLLKKKSRPQGARYLQRPCYTCLHTRVCETRLDLRCSSLPELFLHVDHVPHDLLARHLRPWLPSKESVVLHRNGHHGWCYYA